MKAMFIRSWPPNYVGAFFFPQNTAAECRGYNLQLSETRPLPNIFKNHLLTICPHAFTLRIPILRIKEALS